jgi:glycosyltransferase involved in cell wall biosynthesis
VRIAWFSPLPPMASGIADYSAELLPFLAEEAEVEAFCPAARRGRVVRAPAGIPVLHPRTFGERAHRYDAVFYHLGNNPFHAFVYRASLRWPGVAVLHEVVLHHLIENMLLPDRSSDLTEYGQLLVAEYGPVGRRLQQLRAAGAVTGFELFLFPLSGHVVRASRAAVVHTSGAREQVEIAAHGVPVTVIPHHAGLAPPEVAGISREEARARLGLPPGAFLVGQFGFITKPKQPAAVLDGFQRLLERRPDALLLMVGENQLGVGVQEMVRRRGFQERVRMTGYVDRTRFHLLLKAVDAVVNLRYPSAGEASGTFTRALAEGRAAVVNNLGPFAEVPSDVCLKVEVDGDQAEQVARHLVRLAGDRAFASRLEARARAYARTALDPRRCAEMYLEVARTTAQRPLPAAAGFRPPLGLPINP